MARSSQGRLRAQVAGKGAFLVQRVAAGAAADADVAVPGIKRKDLLVSVIEHAAGGIPVDRTDDTSVVVDGSIRSSDDTTGNALVVTYYSV